MIYPDSFENKIGFTGVRSAVRRHCVSRQGAELVDEMTFLTDFSAVSTLLGQVAEMTAIIESGNDIPLHNVRDVASLLATIAVQGTFLTPEELSTLRKSLESMNDISAFFAADSDSDAPSPYPQLKAVVSGISTFRPCLSEINRVIDPLGAVRDTASQELS
ncbi:MAG: endonuclease MutS2, partial [Paramuribaculum sp.]|nr:endonuclease MutS2 [Paramuribaculum sp.]